VQGGKELSSHPLTIHNDPAHLSRFDELFIVRNDEGQANGQMLIPTMGGDQQGMLLRIV